MSIELSPGDVVSYMEMCSAVGVSLQRGMNYRLCNPESLVLMSRREGAPYADEIDESGRVLIYEGHDCPRTSACPNPKTVDQPERTPSGRLTQNGLFAEAVKRFKELGSPPERVRVFEKIRDGIWAYNGIFELVEYFLAKSGDRQVFKFKLRLVHENDHIFPGVQRPATSDDDDRIIPSWVKVEVWKRDKGMCQIPDCGAKTRLHFDHIIPYSKGGSSKDPNNIQILCDRHNLRKRDRIE